MSWKCKLGIHDWMHTKSCYRHDSMNRIMGKMPTYGVKYTTIYDRICARCEKMDFTATEALEEQKRKDAAAAARCKLREELTMKMNKFREMRQKANGRQD